MSKKVVIVTDNFLPKRDGVTRFLKTIVQEISDKYTITILAPSYNKSYGNEEFYGASVIRFPVSRFGLGGYKAVLVRPKILMPHIQDADIVWLNSMSPFCAAALRAGKKLGKPVIAYKHAIDWDLASHMAVESKLLKKVVRFWLKQPLTYLYNQCNLIMVSSKNIARYITQRGIKTRKIIIPLGVDCDEFKPAKDKNLAKEKLGINPERIVVGYCGRLSAEKNVPTLAKAFSRLHSRYFNLYLLIVGDGNREHVTSYVKKNYRITGMVEDVVPHMQAMDIFVLPSLTETTSLVTLEAMSCGVPAIATPVGHVKEYIENNFNGMLFPRENVDVLQGRIEKLIKDPVKRAKMGKLARKTITTKYSWERTIVQIDRVLSRY
jgi:glycosyltransferase involved in cell wall biosynthesis